jgi:hypothetical protein
MYKAFIFIEQITTVNSSNTTAELVVVFYTIHDCLFVFGATATPPPYPPMGQGLLIHEVSRSRQTTHHIR